MRKLKSHLLVAACTLATLPFHVSAASLADSPAFSLAPKDLQQLAGQQAGSTPSPAVVLLDDEHWTFLGDRTIERKLHVIFKVLDQSAIQGWSSVQERWEPWHQARPLYRARVITADGIPHELDPKTLVDAPAGGNLPQSYSDLRVLQGPLPAIAVGAIVESELIDHFTPILGSLAFRAYVAGLVPIRFSRLSVDYPESLPFRYRVNLCPDLKESKESREGVVHLTLSFGAFDSIKEIDPLLPFDVPRIASIVFSTGSSWSDLAAHYGAVIDKQIADAPVANLVDKTLQGEKNRLVIIQKLVRALHAEVRYTGVEFADAAIVPAKPAETLSRKYGDCKDKAALLVAMLRAAGIPSYLAILNAGLEEDVVPQHPGMGMFNHAIVYVPGLPEFWIDATAEYFRVGPLPPPDQGRLALIIRPETKDLVKTPESASTDSTLFTGFDYDLPEFGPSHVVATLLGTGLFEGSFREMMTLLDNEELRKRAQEQNRAQWQTTAEIKMSHPPLNDFSRPFQIVTDVPDTKTLSVSETGASLPISFQEVFSSLPAFFTADDAKENDPAGKKKPRSAGFVLPTAFVAKLSYRIQIPAGLSLKKIPEDQTVNLGPATFAAHYVLKDRLFTADISFDSAKRQYTLEEGNALKTATIKFLKQPASTLNFAPFGQTLLDEGHLREGLDTFRALAAQQGAQAVNHIRLSRAYLLTGCGAEARTEAKVANQAAPEFVATWRNLAFVQEHDLVGRKYKPGWQPAAVEMALRKVVALDPADLTAPVELAESFSYDLNGYRFRSMERLAKAIEVFHSMGDENVEKQGAQDTMIFELAVLGKLDEMKSKLDRFGANGTRAGYPIYLTAVRQGGAAAAAELQASASGEELRKAFVTAIDLLATTGQYRPEADLATALGLQSQLFMPAANLRNVRRFDPQTIQLDSPENAVKRFVVAMFDPAETPESLARFWSASLSPQLRALLQIWHQALLGGATQHGVAPEVGRDVYLSNLTATTEANGTAGFRVRATMGRALTLFVIREPGGCKLLGNSEFSERVAEQVLLDLQSGKQAVARQWLNWLREDIKIRSEDDPLGGPVFPRIWNKGAAASTAQIRYAAASLTHSQDSLPLLQEAIHSTSDPAVKAYYQLAYVGACLYLKNGAGCFPVAKSLAAAYPASNTALHFLSAAAAAAGQLEAVENTIRQAITKSPNDLSLKRSFANSLGSAKRPKESVALAKEIAESPNAAIYDWNQYAWISLFAGNTDEEKIHALERAQSQPIVSVQHTVAAMYAEIGKVNEARQLSLQTLDKFGYATVPSEWWYVFGRISEQLGAKSSAVLYYGKVLPDPHGLDPLSVYALALKRLLVLNSPRAIAN